MGRLVDPLVVHVVVVGRLVDPLVVHVVVVAAACSCCCSKLNLQLIFCWCPGIFLLGVIVNLNLL